MSISKLAGAAIAYQYELDPEHPTSDRIQFVVVDEMFSRVDDQHAESASGSRGRRTAHGR